MEDHAVRPPRRSDTMLNIGDCICERRQCSTNEMSRRLDWMREKSEGGEGRGKVPRSLSCHDNEERRPGIGFGEVGEDIG